MVAPTVLVYGLKRPNDKWPLYIGRTDGSIQSRLTQHKKHARNFDDNRPVLRWIRNTGGDVVAVPVATISIDFNSYKFGGNVYERAVIMAHADQMVMCGIVILNVDCNPFRYMNGHVNMECVESVLTRRCGRKRAAKLMQRITAFEQVIANGVASSEATP